MNIEDFKSLWDGSEPGWVVKMYTQDIWQLVFHFSQEGPDARQIQLLRQLVPELMSAPLPAVHKLLKGEPCYRTTEVYGSIDGHRLRREAEQLGFQVLADVTRNISYLPIRDDSFVPVIEDKQLARAVALKMIERGVPLLEVHSD